MISSNSEQELVEKLAAQLKMSCDLALGYRENFAKGMPHFLYILKHFGVELSSVVFIGDSLKDLERAEECGVYFIGKEGMFSAKDFHKNHPGLPVISALADLKKIF